MPERVVITPDGKWLSPAAAASYARMRAAGCPPGIESAGRTTAEQDALRRRYLAGDGPFALPPGTSRHEDGDALDLHRAAATWVKAHGRGHGWRFTNPDEWWHAEHFPAQDRHQEDDVTPEQIEAAVRAATWKLWKEAADGSSGTGREMGKAVLGLVGRAVDEQSDELVAAIAAGLPAVAGLSKDQVRQAVEAGVRNVLKAGVGR